MARLLGVLVLCAGLALAQEGGSGIGEDEAPAAEAEKAAPARTTPAPAREPGKRPATVPIRKKVFSFPLPADWVLEDTEDPKAEVAWNVLLPGSTERAELMLFRDDGIGDPRSAPFYYNDSDTWEGQKEVRQKPVPRFMVTRPGGDWVNGWFFFAVKNNRYFFRLSCSDKDFPQAEQDLIASVQGLAAEVEIWPPIPKGYEAKQEGCWLVARAPSVTGSIAPLLAGLKDAEKRFKRDHGALPKRDAPIVVLVHGSAAETARVEPGAADAPEGFHADVTKLRLFAVPFAKNNLDNLGWLAGAAHGVLFMAKYGDVRPNWIFNGECTVARAEAVTGKQLPSLDEGFVNWANTLKLHTLDELEALRSTDGKTWNIEAFFYVAMLQNGKHKKAYRAFLDGFAETGDGRAACAQSIGPIAQDALRAATNDFVYKKIRMEKRAK